MMACFSKFCTKEMSFFIICLIKKRHFSRVLLNLMGSFFGCPNWYASSKISLNIPLSMIQTCNVKSSCRSRGCFKLPSRSMAEPHWATEGTKPSQVFLTFWCPKDIKRFSKVHSQFWDYFWKSVLKVMKNVFYFTLTALFILKLFKFLS